MKNILR